MPVKSKELTIKDFTGGYINPNALPERMFPMKSFSIFRNLYLQDINPRRRRGYEVIYDARKVGYNVAYADKITNLALIVNQATDSRLLYYAYQEKLYVKDLDSGIIPEYDITPPRSGAPGYEPVPQDYQIPFVYADGYMYFTYNGQVFAHKVGTSFKAVGFYDMFYAYTVSTPSYPVAGVLNGTYRYIATFVYYNGTESTHYYPFGLGSYTVATPVNQKVRLTFAPGSPNPIWDNVQYIRFYRTKNIAGSPAPDKEPYYFIEQIGKALTWDDNTPDTELVDEYDSIEYVAPTFPVWIDIQNNRLVITSNDNTVYFSDTYLYGSIRPELTISISTSGGGTNDAHATAYLNGIHYIFCKNAGVYSIRETGNPTLPFVMEELNQSYGVDAPQLCRRVGNLIVIMYKGKLHAFNGRDFSYIGRALGEVYFTYDIDAWSKYDGDAYKLRTAVDNELQELHILSRVDNPDKHVVYNATKGYFRTEDYSYNAYTGIGSPTLAKYTTIPVAIDFSTHKVLSTPINSIVWQKNNFLGTAPFRDDVGSAGAVGGTTNYYVEAELEKLLYFGDRTHLKSVIMYGRATPGGATSNAGYTLVVNGYTIGSGLGISEPGNELGVNLPGLYHRVNVKQNIGSMVDNDFNIEYIGLKYMSSAKQNIKETAT